MRRSKRDREDTDNPSGSLLIQDRMREPIAGNVLMYLSPSSLGALRSSCRTLLRWFDYGVFLETSLPAVGTRMPEGFIFSPLSQEDLMDEGIYFPVSSNGLLPSSVVTTQIAVVLNLRYFSDEKTGFCKLEWSPPLTFDAGLIRELLVVGTPTVRRIGDRFLCNLQGLTKVQFRNVGSIERIGDYFLSKLGIQDVDLSPFTGLTSIGSNFLSSTYGLSHLSLELPNLETLGDDCLKYSAVRSLDISMKRLCSAGCNWMRFCPELKEVKLSLPCLRNVGDEWLVQCDLLKPEDANSIFEGVSSNIEKRAFHIQRFKKR